MTDTKHATNKLISSDVPMYPAFRLFELSDKDWYTEYYRTFEPASDLGFSNIVVWLNINEDVKISQLNDNVLLTFTSVLDKNEHILTLFGRNNIDETLKTIFDDGTFNKVSFSPKVVCDNIKDKNAFIIEPERDNFEYILSAPLLASLEGPEIRKLRREVRTFEKEHGTNTLGKEEDLTDPAVVENMKRHYLKDWPKALTLTHNNKEGYELSAIARSFELAPHTGNKLFCIYIDGVMEGFIIYQLAPQKGHSVLNHIKTSYKYRYIFDYILHIFAQYMITQGIDYINFEQDLGLEGLREHKLSLKPVGYFEKYSIYPR